MAILPSMVQKKLLSARNLIELLRRKFSESSAQIDDDFVAERLV